MRRSVHRKALAALLAVVAVTVAVLVALARKYALNPEITWYANSKLPHVRSTFGDDAALVCLVAAPLIVWLVHKAFFSRFRR